MAWKTITAADVDGKLREESMAGVFACVGVKTDFF